MPPPRFFCDIRRLEVQHNKMSECPTGQTFIPEGPKSLSVAPRHLISQKNAGDGQQEGPHASGWERCEFTKTPGASRR